MLTITAIIKAQPGTEEEAAEILRSLIEPSRKDAGCISYDMHINASDSGEFMFYEKWESQEALDAHMQTPHVKDALGKVKLASEPVITPWLHQK